MTGVARKARTASDATADSDPVFCGDQIQKPVVRRFRYFLRHGRGHVELPAGADRGADPDVSVERESARSRTLALAGPVRSFLTVANASVTRRLAPRGEPHDPLRSRCATITGAPVLVVRVAISAFKPRTPEYP